jgi:hypothetical protein
MAVERSVSDLLLGSFDYVWTRVRSRCEGLTQEEYLWKPVAGCWTVKLVDGVWRVPPRAGPGPDPAPVTTIAWRLWHIASDCLATYAKGLTVWPLEVEDTEWYGEVDEALAATDRAWDAFRTALGALGEDGMWTPLGKDWGPYAPEPWAALVVHALDEIAHHGAEIALLRDLYAHQKPKPPKVVRRRDLG